MKRLEAQDMRHLSQMPGSELCETIKNSVFVVNVCYSIHPLH